MADHPDDLHPGTGLAMARVRAERDHQTRAAAAVDRHTRNPWTDPELVPGSIEQFPPVRGVAAWFLAGVVVGAAVTIAAAGDAVLRRLEARRDR